MCKRLTCLTFLVLVLGLVLPAAADPALVGYWTFDEGSGTIVNDSSGQGNNGIIEGDPQWVAGKIGGAMQFDGDDDQIQLTAVFTTLGSSSNTVATWIKVPLPGTEGLGATERVGNLLGTYNDSPNSNWELHAAGQMRLWWNNGEFDGRGTTDLRDNIWHHVAWVRDKAANASYMYIDGGLEATISTVGTDITFNTAHKIAADNRGSSTPNWHGLLDDLQVYIRALSQAEIAGIMNGLFREVASSPSPADGTVDVRRDTVLSWEPGEYASAVNGHIVYLSESFNDVSDGIGGVSQSAAAYAPPQRLNLGTTYYWRVDEVNAPPDSTVYPGEVWSFTTEPVGYPVDGANITATASSSMSDSSVPERTIDGSGLNDSDQHSTIVDDMWLSNFAGPQPTWIEYQFDRVYKLHEMWVWNQNQQIETTIGYGFKDVSIEYSVDGVDYTTLGTAHEFARASGGSDYSHNTTVDLSGVTAQYVRLTANSNWGGLVPQFGLSEVRFFFIPVSAREPSPESGAANVDVNTTLGWRAGREAAAHDVYLSTHEQAVIDGTIAAETVTDASYTSSFDLGGTYYWRIDEANDAETPTLWQSDVWNFTTQEFIVVDDFEAYNDIEAGQEDSNLIYETWADGFDNPSANGSTMGYTELFQPTMESGIVHGGRQSAPMEYNNTTATLSEVTRTFAVPQDWTKHGIQTLTLWFHGRPDNTGQLYVKVNGSKLVYDGEAADMQRGWQAWNIELASFGTNLQSVTTLTIGVEGPGATGSLFLDDIRLYAYSRQLITPIEPDSAALVGHWKFDEGSGTTAYDQSGQGNDATFQGNPKYVPGMINGALQFDGDDDQITLAEVLPVGSSSNTVALWLKVPLAGTAGLADAERVGIVLGSYPDSPNTNWEIASQGQTRLYWNGGQFNSYGTTDLRDNVWHHVAWVRDKAANACYTYIDGRLEAAHPAAGADVTFATAHSIGGDNRSDPPNFHGLMDDLQIHSRALSHAEVGWLAGRTLPFDKPF